jgi:hypothetical protein
VIASPGRVLSNPEEPVDGTLVTGLKAAGRARLLHTCSVTAAGPARPELTLADSYYVKAFVHTYYARSAWHHAFNALCFDVRLERCGAVTPRIRDRSALS